MQSLDIIIAGAGMGGLTSAIALQRTGHRVRLFERVTELAPIGSGITLWPNAVKVLAALGLGEAIAAVGGDLRSMSYSDQQGRLLTRFSLEPLYQQVQQRACPISRAELQRILLRAAGPQRVTLGVGCLGYQEDDQGVTVSLSSGERLRADLLVAADGTHSKLRNAVTGQDIPRRYRGYVNWNGRVAIDPALNAPREWSQLVGDNKRVSLLPMSPELLYFFFDVPLPLGTPNRKENYRAELAGHFAGWAEPVQRLIQRFDPDQMARLEIHDTDRLPRLVTQRVALLGDSAHATAPNIGQGGGQAMEDAWVLARSLESAPTIYDALQSYQEQRAERAARLVLKARERAAIIHGEDPEATAAWYKGLESEDGGGVIAGMAKTALGGPLG